MRFQEFMQKSLLMEVHQKYQRFFTPLVKDLREEGLNLNEALILLALFFEPKQDSTPSELANTLFLGKDQISQALKKLEALSFIRIKSNIKDRRIRHISLTSLARDEATKMVNVFETYENQIESQD